MGAIKRKVFTIRRAIAMLHVGAFALASTQLVGGINKIELPEGIKDVKFEGDNELFAEHMRMLTIQKLTYSVLLKKDIKSPTGYSIEQAGDKVIKYKCPQRDLNTKEISDRFRPNFQQDGYRIQQQPEKLSTIECFCMTMKGVPSSRVLLETYPDFDNEGHLKFCLEYDDEFFKYTSVTSPEGFAILQLIKR